MTPSSPSRVPVILMSILLVICAILIGGFVSFRQSALRIKSSVSQPANPPTMPIASDSVFANAISPDTFDRLTVEDIPYVSDLRRAVAYKDHVIVAAYTKGVQEYDRQGKLIRFSKKGELDCAGDVAVIGDRLYVACWEKGVEVIDLVSGKRINEFSKQNGMPSVQNLRFAVDGSNLWVATYEGLAKIDTQTDTIRSYQKELGGDCQQYGTQVTAYRGDVWATMNASSLCRGGLAHYQSATDSWTYFGPQDLLTRWKPGMEMRVDFERFSVSQEGIFALYQDTGPDHVILAQYDAAAKTWKRIWDLPFEKSEEMRKTMPLAENYLGYQIGAQTADKQRYLVPFRVGDDAWETVPLAIANYQPRASLRRIENTYYLLSDRGMEVLAQGAIMPRVILSTEESLYQPDGTSLLLSVEDRYLIILSNNINEMLGQTGADFILIFDRASEKAWRADLGSEQPFDLHGSFVVRGETFVIRDASGKEVISVDLQKKTVQELTAPGRTVPLKAL